MPINIYCSSFCVVQSLNAKVTLLAYSPESVKSMRDGVSYGITTCFVETIKAAPEWGSLCCDVLLG